MSSIEKLLKLANIVNQKNASIIPILANGNLKKDI